ncbi:hypothetical protein C0J52_12370 [Blattella germanica]|nr:hypothetical protein C0J52_12370 [Blattella germanica]
MKSKNEVLSVEPPTVNFEFKNINETYDAFVKLNNISGKALRVYILPQLSKYFQVDPNIKLYIPSLSTSPFAITVIADCKPGLARENLLLEATTKKPIVIFEQPQKTLLLEKKVQPIEQQEDPIETLKKLNTHHGVVKFLLAKEPPGPSATEIIGPLGRYMNEERKIYQTKEKQFREAMAKFQADNQAALLHNRDKLGHPLEVSMELIEQVTTQRLADQEEFENVNNEFIEMDQQKQAANEIQYLPEKQPEEEKEEQTEESPRVKKKGKGSKDKKESKKKSKKH